jgi:hypothetical protein
MLGVCPHGPGDHFLDGKNKHFTRHPSSAEMLSSIAEQVLRSSTRKRLVSDGLLWVRKESKLESGREQEKPKGGENMG